MILKAHTHGNPKSVQPSCDRIYSGRRGACSGFSICLFLVVLSVFGWVVHRRLSQYGTPQHAVHQSTAIKVCVTKRNPICVPSTHGTDAFAVFLAAFTYTATLIRPSNSEAAVALGVQRDRSAQHADADTRPSLDHFFVLPPPLRKSVL